MCGEAESAEINGFNNTPESFSAFVLYMSVFNYVLGPTKSYLLQDANHGVSPLPATINLKWAQLLLKDHKPIHKPTN